MSDIRYTVEVKFAIGAPVWVHGCLPGHVVTYVISQNELVEYTVFGAGENGTFGLTVNDFCLSAREEGVTKEPELR